MSKFYDIDLPFGEKYEQQLKEFFEGTNIEVKTERDIWKETGNHVVEYKYKGNPSEHQPCIAEPWGIFVKYKGSPSKPRRAAQIFVVSAKLQRGPSES